MLYPIKTAKHRKLFASVYSREYALANNHIVLSGKEYCDTFHVHKNTMRYQINKGELKAFKQGNKWFVLVKNV